MSVPSSESCWRSSSPKCGALLSPKSRPRPKFDSRRGRRRQRTSGTRYPRRAHAARPRVLRGHPPVARRSSLPPRAPPRPRPSDRTRRCCITAARRCRTQSTASSSRTNCSTRCPPTSVVMTDSGLREVFVDVIRRRIGETASSSSDSRSSRRRASPNISRAPARRCAWAGAPK